MPIEDGKLEVTIVNENLEMSSNAMDRGGLSVPPLTEDDRTLRSWALSIKRRAAGGSPEVHELAEDDGTPKVVNYGKDAAGNQDAIRINASQQAMVQLVGADESPNDDVLRTDPNRILWTRPFENWINVDPLLIPNSEGILYNPGTTAAQIYWILYKVVNIDASGAAVTVSVGADIAAGGGLATIEYDMFNEIIPYPGTSGWRDLGMIGGDDDVRGIASAANDAIIRFKIRRVDTGA